MQHVTTGFFFATFFLNFPLEIFVGQCIPFGLCGRCRIAIILIAVAPSPHAMGGPIPERRPGVGTGGWDDGCGGAMGLVVSVTPPLNNRLLVGVVVAALANSRRDLSNEDAVMTLCIW